MCDTNEPASPRKQIHANITAQCLQKYGTKIHLSVPGADDG